MGGLTVYILYIRIMIYLNVEGLLSCNSEFHSLTYLVSFEVI